MATDDAAPLDGAFDETEAPTGGPSHAELVPLGSLQDDSGGGQPDFSLEAFVRSRPPAEREPVRQFGAAIGPLFEQWIARSTSPETRRAYRRDLLAFADFLGVATTGKTLDDRTAWQLLDVPVTEVLEWREHLEFELTLAPKTIRRRVGSVSRFYEFLRAAATEARVPFVVPNPADKHFVPRATDRAISPTRALSTDEVRRLKEMSPGDRPIDYRDRAILRFYLYTGARISTGCRVRIEDCQVFSDDASILISEKGKGRSKRAIGIHTELAWSLQEYLEFIPFESGPLFRAVKGPRTDELGDKGLNSSGMYRILTSYLRALPRAVREVELADGSKVERCVYTPHSIRATCATLAHRAGVEAKDIQDLLGHAQLSTTEIYIERDQSTEKSASHKLPY